MYRLLSTLLFAGFASAACSPDAAVQGDPAENEVIARVNDRSITAGELDVWIKNQLFEREVTSKGPGERFEVRSRAVSEMIDQMLIEAEADSRGVDTEAVFQQEIEALGPVSDEEVSKFYEEHRNRFRASDTLEALTPRIRAYLSERRRSDVVAAIRSEAKIEIQLEPPRLAIEARGPARGPDDAPITIVEFSDYECPYCKRTEPVVQSLIERYPDRVRLVYRHFPLDSIHKDARGAAEAAVCADEQGQFWAFHEKVFENQGALSEADLLTYATDIGLDVSAFKTCSTSPDTRERVEADVAAGKEAGVTGTPAFFVNGIPLSGARPIEDFVRTIERELARQAPVAES
jgi:protein-disulfide isomerase